MSLDFSLLRRALLLLILLCTAPCLVSRAMAQDAPPLPLAQFFGNPEVGKALLSPDARLLAMRMEGPNQRQRLVVVKLSDMSLKVVAEFKALDIRKFEWVNEHRLVFDTTDSTEAQRDVTFAPGLFAVNSDGSGYTQLVNHNNSGSFLRWNTFLSEQKGLQDSDDVYVVSPHWDNKGEPDYTSLRRLNTVTGDSTLIEQPANANSWLLDHQGQPRLVVASERNMDLVYYLDPATNNWRKLAEFDSNKGSQDAFYPFAFAPDGTFYVTSNAGRDTTALYRYDLVAGKLTGEPLVELQDYDFNGSLITDRHQLLGVRFVGDAIGTSWFSPAMQSTQARIDATLKDTINLLSVAARPETPYILVQSYSDRQPAIYWLFNTETSQLTKVANTHPEIEPARMASQSLVHYKARDGLSIPAWLTLPHGSTRKNLPLVMLVHGGPYVRGKQWSWDAEAQFLASRGYAVLEPEYRGSTGFGKKHFMAGWKQWGLKMQDDIADGARWAITEGIVDAKRICIAGASYGGYATLMGLINDPDLYRCGINWIGVTDINLMYNGHWTFSSDLTEQWKQYGMPELIGDQDKDAEQLKATSPLQQAARIKQPLLMAYGGVDERVPAYHGKLFYKAVRENNKKVELVIYSEEGHGWYLPKNRIDFWGRVEKFLDANIGNGRAATKKE